MLYCYLNVLRCIISIFLKKKLKGLEDKVLYIGIYFVLIFKSIERKKIEYFFILLYLYNLYYG